MIFRTILASNDGALSPQEGVFPLVYCDIAKIYIRSETTQEMSVRDFIHIVDKALNNWEMDRHPGISFHGWEIIDIDGEKFAATSTGTTSSYTNPVPHDYCVILSI